MMIMTISFILAIILFIINLISCIILIILNKYKEEIWETVVFPNEREDK